MLCRKIPVGFYRGHPLILHGLIVRKVNDSELFLAAELITWFPRVPRSDPLCCSCWC